MAKVPMFRNGVPLFNNGVPLFGNPGDPCCCEGAVICVRCPSSPNCCIATDAYVSAYTKPSLVADATPGPTGDIKLGAAAQFALMPNTLTTVITNGSTVITFNAYSDTFEVDGETYRVHVFFNPCSTAALKADIEQLILGVWTGVIVLFTSEVGADPTWNCCTWSKDSFSDNSGDNAVTITDQILELALSNNRCCRVGTPVDTWDEATTYDAGDAVYTGSFYVVSLQDGNIGNDPNFVGAPWWEQIFPGSCNPTATDNCPDYDDCGEVGI